MNYRASQSPLFSATLQGEYRVPLSLRADGYLRAQATINGDSQNDPTVFIDDINGYTQLNLFAGLRDPRGAWEVTVYGRNVTKTERVLSRTSTPLTASYRQVAASLTGVSTYRGVTYTAPREFGVNVRYAFGSR